jgi:hypothetical protein
MRRFVGGLALGGAIASGVYAFLVRPRLLDPGSTDIERTGA